MAQRAWPNVRGTDQTKQKSFLPRNEWDDLNQDQKDIKDATVEMFLKTLELISTFH